MELLIASNNSGKVKEIRNYLSDLGLSVYSLPEFQKKHGLIAPIPDPEETGQTYLENALIKAEACYAWAGIPCLSDDTGLEVVDLGNAPGLFTARYAGVSASFDDNMQKLLRELQEEDNRRAKFKACLVFFDGLDTRTFEGEIEGEILKEKKGDGGFGYDPIFKPDYQNLSLAELKNLSLDFPTHRLKALAKFKEFLLA